MKIRGLKAGIVGGLVGGFVFGVLMSALGTLSQIGELVGRPTTEIAFAVHIVVSAAIGVGYAVVSGFAAKTRRRGLYTGVLYGLAWWFIGPLTVMPLMLGAQWGAQWNVAALANQTPSLVGHLLFGAVLGGTYAHLMSLERRAARRQARRESRRATPNAPISQPRPAHR